MVQTHNEKVQAGICQQQVGHMIKCLCVCVVVGVFPLTLAKHKNISIIFRIKSCSMQKSLQHKPAGSPLLDWH